MNFQFKIFTRSLLALSTVVSLSFTASAAEPADVSTAAPSAASAASPVVSVAPTNSVAPGTPVVATVSPAERPNASPGPMTASGKKKLLSEFAKAQSNQEKAAIHTSRSELKELQAAQSQRSRSWRETERKKRKDFFESHASGPDRRAFVQDYLKRKKELDAAQKGDLEDFKKKWAMKLDELRKKQKERAAEFKSKVDQGQAPDASLWPN
ncbi:MAG: hypothetical protein JST80_05580 [Bdellovibrionales bacterium]|nr:hypothetical protein [Bdellovibrionales bacterium]